MAFDETTAIAMRDVARLEQRVAELEAALRRLQCDVGVSVEAHDIIAKVIGTPQRPVGVKEGGDAQP